MIMKSDLERTTSTWMREQGMTERPPLREDLDVDVCVVGAGIAGLSTAYFAAQSGLTVAVIDDGQVACGQTARTTAHLSAIIDDRFLAIEKAFGIPGSRAAHASHAAAIDAIEGICREEGIECQFERVNAYLFGPKGDAADRVFLRRELAAAQRAGVEDAFWMERAPGPLRVPSPTLCFPRQAQFHPTRYAAGLAAACERKGARIFGRTHATAMSGGARAVIKTKEVDGDGQATIRAGHLVVATNSPVNDRVVIHTKQAAYRTYVVALKIPTGSLEHALYWDTVDPYHYVRVEADLPDAPRGFDLLIVGGEDHRTGQEHDNVARYARLKEWARERFPMATETYATWSGQVMETVDGLAYIGRNPLDQNNVYIATGDSGMGMTHGTIAGMLITDLIAGRANPWASLYDPGRAVTRAIGEFTRENLVTLAWYAKWLNVASHADGARRAPGEGWVERHGLTQVAKYKDERGHVHSMSAVCPHLGGIVSWNGGEGTWDCPCHGSRFDAWGHVISGPANAGLRPIAEESAAEAPQGQPWPAPTAASREERPQA